MGSALYALVGTAILRGAEEFFGGVILSEQIPGSKIPILVIRVVLEVQGYRYF
jgi:hypothetical protein